MMSPGTQDRLRVVIADDSVLLREGIARLLEESGFEVAGQAGDGEDLLRKVGAHKPDVAVIDMRMPPTHSDEGLRAARHIRANHPATAVVVLSQYVDETYALKLLSEIPPRASATSSRTASPTSTRSLTRCAASREAVRRLIQKSSRCCSAGGSARTRSRCSPPRERKVLGLMAEGRSNAGDGGRAHDQRACGGEARDRHPLQARPTARGSGPSTCACRPGVPAPD